MTSSDAGYLGALAGFERMTAGRLRSLLDRASPADAFAIAAGRIADEGPIGHLLRRDPDLAGAWRRSAARRRPEACAAQLEASAIAVVRPDDPGYPGALRADPWRPAALFVRGEPTVAERRRVGIVGTRNATQRGRETAARFGRRLAAEGIAVVSGLALGVDAAAHRGTLADPDGVPIAVVGNGLDRPYPKRNADLWDGVAQRGVLFSEWPPGTPPDAFRFPMRNRIIAALSEVLVVVESRERGGSLITAREALERGVTVMAVPGGLDQRSSAGTNELLRDGAAPALDADDVLLALGLDGTRAEGRSFDPRRPPAGVGQQLIDACAERPRTLEQLTLLGGGALATTAMLVARLERDGWLRETGGWFEAIEGWDPRGSPGR